MKHRFFPVFSFLIFCAAGFAQNGFFDNYVYQAWSAFGGLTGTTATDILQTQDGYLNIGTYEGLVRFDGVAFTTIKKNRENGLSFASARTLLEDKAGNLWVGSNDEGVQKISRSGNASYNMQNGLPNNSVRALAEDKAGNIWIGTATGVVYLTPEGSIVTPEFAEGSAHKGVIAVSLYCDTAGRMWLLTAGERGLYCFSDGAFRTMPEMDSFGNYFATAIAQDLMGNFWIGMGNQGIVRVRNGIVSQIKTGTLLDSVPTWAIYMGIDGTIWFGTEKGLAVYNTGEFFEYQRGDLGSPNINKIICDREGNIWIATDRNGIGKLSHGKFKVTDLGVPSNAIAEDAQGRIWIGTDKGVLCYENEKPVQNALTEFTRDVRIRHVGVTRRGGILVSCYTKPGQLLYENGVIKSWTTDDGLAGNKVRVAVETSDNEFYVGTTTGLSIIRPDGSIRSFGKKDGIDNEYIMCIHKDNNGVVWVGTDGGGIYLMDNEKLLSRISSEDGLAGNVIFKITQDKNGAFWICTGSGLTILRDFDSLYLHPTDYVNLNSENGLVTDSVFQIIPDTNGNMWLTSNHGIASVASAELQELIFGKRRTVNIKFYNKNDGLDSDGPTSTALSICDHHGRLWFTMVDGFAVYDPVKIQENPVTPLAHIESVIVDNVEIPESELENLVLRPGTRRVEIKFTGLSFDSPERLLFSHRLTGFEDDFTPPDSGRTVSYTNLRPGRHVFYVNAINGNGLMSENASTVLFIQKPYFYQMPLFWIAVTVLVLGGIALVFYYKQRKIKLENIRLEQMVQMRTAQLHEALSKSDYLLHSILPDKIAEELRDDIHSIGEDFSDVTLLFSDIVGFTKISSGHKADEIVGALNDLFSRFDERAKKMGVEKIKTIGDAYMAACGIPIPNERHAEVMVRFAKGMYEDLAAYNKTAQIQFSMRIGLNCGPVTAGVIGKTKFIYDVWGNTVNVASRMESACSPGQIRVTETVRRHLEGTDVQFGEPEEIDIKGKGLMKTYEIRVS